MDQTMGIFDVDVIGREVRCLIFGHKATFDSADCSFGGASEILVLA